MTGIYIPVIPQDRYRSGFTLFEVSISLALVAFGVISVLMLIPSGIKAQQMSRYQILASARALELIQMFSSSTDSNVMMDREGVNPWDTVGSYRSYSPDLEARIGNFRFGLIPLPLDIAMRLDSENDEIHKILSDGGHLYYSQPLATTGFNPVGERANAKAPSEAQKLLVAVTGYAQQNAVSMFPYKDWPYYAPYPSPPMHGGDKEQDDSRVTAQPGYYQFTNKSEKINGLGNKKNRVDEMFFDERDKIILWEDSIEYDMLSLPNEDKGDMGVLFNGVVRGPALPGTDAWVRASVINFDSNPKVRKAMESNQFLRGSGYWAYGERGWIPDYFSEPVEDNKLNYSPTGVKGWAQIRPNGIKGFNNDYKIQPEKITETGLPGSLILENPVANRITQELSYESAIAYFALASWYAKKRGVADAILQGQRIFPGDSGNLDPTASNKDLLAPHKLFQVTASAKPICVAVNAARFLAHAALCLTAHQGLLENSANLKNGSRLSLEVCRENKPMTADLKSDGLIDFIIPDRATIQVYHENAMQLVMRYAASHPYDWGSPRPLNRAIMMDFPLIQYDPFGGFITPDIGSFGSPPSYNYGQVAQQWKLISAQPITNIGRSVSYLRKSLAADSAGIFSLSSNHFTLTRPFSPYERCRQLVFWAVDWQSYEDFETAPSAPVDASRYTRAAPVNNKSSLAELVYLNPNGKGNVHPQWQDRYQFSMRNPEKVMLFAERTDDKPTGADIEILGPDNPNADNFAELDQPGRKAAGRGSDHLNIFLGLYGADRNFNGNQFILKNGNKAGLIGRLDRGPLPRSVRMRAATVARFNFYDPRLSLVNR